ncbi:hypothetical protein [Anaeromicropila herbilytica]|uniref:Tetratricopeptide repeat protein n=1 Tax=Anaeromicropila herbilytica TaxID=2785025 RepID=A0A7R7ICM2_9FIRM|nr:hypothetical protein [Anaeromicropila herbilytica]BCN30021.1 hypothetical protein bsdtb5_13160 [Anaeromicropila herbilytica]
MGKIILCSGRKAEHPFYFKLTNTNVYSIEELCYYIYNNIYLIGDELYQPELADWLINEVKMNEIGIKLKEYIQNKHSMKDIVVSILCSADYYTEDEIIELIKVIDEIALLSPIRRLKLKADKYINYQNYSEAILLYQEIIGNKEAAVFTEEEYGNILHNIAIALLNISSYHEAAEYFESAYLRNKNPESLMQCMYTLILGEDSERKDRFIKEHNISDELMSTIYQKIKDAEEKAIEASSYKEIMKIKELKDAGKGNDYYQKINQMLRELK